MPPRPDRDFMLNRLVALFVLLTLGIVFVGSLYHEHSRQHLKKNMEDELSTVADLKVRQIVAWRSERAGDAEAITRNPFVTTAVDAYFRADGPPAQGKEISRWMSVFLASYDYRSLQLIDANGRVRLTVGDVGSEIGPHARAIIAQARHLGRAVLSEFHRADAADYPHLDLAVPLSRTTGRTTTPIGTLFIRIDPEKFLYPLIETWPSMGLSAETLLVRRDGDDILFLNRLRHRSDPALTLRIPLDQKPHMARLLATPEKGMLATRDYRDVPVLAAMVPVPGTAWSLVAKIDEEELYAPAREQARLLTAVVIILVLATGMSVVFWWRKRNAENLQQQYAGELEHRMLSERYGYLSRYGNDIIIAADQDGKIIEVNDRAVAAYGRSREELLGLSLGDIRADAGKQDIAPLIEQVRRQNGLVFEAVHVRKDGTSFPVEVSSRVLGSDGRSVYLSIIRDITERKEAERTLQENQTLLQAIINTEPECVKLVDRDGSLLMMNPAGLQMIEAASLDQVRGQCLYPLVAEEQRGAFQQLTEAVFRGESGTLEFEILGLQGGRRWLATHAVPLRNSRGEITALLGVTRDISERRRVDEALRARNRFIEAALDNLPIGLGINTVSTGSAVYMNPAFEKIYGWPKQDLSTVDKFFEHVFPDPAYRDAIRKRVIDDMATGDPARMEWENIPITTSTGEQRIINARNTPLPEQDLIFSTVQDVTRRQLAEQAQIESESRYRKLVESLTDYIYTVEVRNGAAVTTLHGPGCVSVTGYTSEEYWEDPDLWYRMIYEEDRKTVIEQAALVLSGVSVPPYEHRIIHKDGSLRWVKNTPVLRFDDAGKLIAYDGLITDITQLKVLENQLRQAQKMEAVGQLAGGVAHDFNNILTAIIGYANLLLMKMPKTETSRPYVDQILSSAERAAQLTHSLLTFSRKQVIDLRPVNINQIIRRVEKLLCRVIGEDIAFTTRLSDDELIVLADSVQVEQVLMNLAANARDAMPDGGSLMIETSPVELGEDFVRTHSYAKPGRYVVISVSDTGTGMDEAVRSRVFEPFFTTKEVGKGTGLGLAMVYGIVKQHNGYIHVASKPGEGTAFTIYLPLVAAASEDGAPVNDESVPGGTETILLAEDDEPVRRLTSSVLRDFGYQVIEAVDGEDAVRQFREHRDGIDLLVLDIVMPRKNGKEAYQEIGEMKPGIKALFTSGYTADVVHKKGILDAGLDFIYKPSTPAVFMRKVRQVLDRKN